MLVVENRRNAGCGLITLFWSSSVSRPDDFQHALDHEHHVGTAGVVFVEAQRDVVLQRPGQNAFAEFGDLLAVPEHDRVLADQIDAADMAVEIDAHAGPVEPRRDLLDMGGLAGAVIARDHHAAVAGRSRPEWRAWSAGRSDSPDRCPARARPAPNRPALPCRCRCRTPGGPKPSCPASRIHCQLRESLLLRDPGRSERRLGNSARQPVAASAIPRRYRCHRRSDPRSSRKAQPAKVPADRRRRRTSRRKPLEVSRSPLFSSNCRPG